MENNKEFEEIIKKTANEKHISDTEKQKLIKNLSSLSAYTQELNRISIPSYNNKVIYTSGNKQLLFENGEFFEVSAIDATKERVKLTRKEATDKYIEYFIGNVLNPLIARKNEMGIEYKKREVKDVQKEIEDTPIVSRSKKEQKSKSDDMEMEI